MSGGWSGLTLMMMAVLCVRGALTFLWTMEACQRLRRIGGRITRILCDICRWAEFYLSPLPGTLALLKSLQILCMWVGEASWCRLAAEPWLEKITVDQPFGGLHQPLNQLLAVCAGLFFTSLWRFAGLFFTSPWRFASAS